jgi:mono/diheme cytochrome c family protein
MAKSRVNRVSGGRMAALAGAATALLGLAGCHVDMWTQPKVQKPLQASNFFADKSSARPIVEGTVARRPEGEAQRLGNPFYTGFGTDGKLLDALPANVPLSRELLKRGQERYNIYCSPCHGATGDGQGMIAMRGLAQRVMPRNYHEERVRRMPIGHYFDVITNGFGAMYSYRSRIEPADRWAIAAYIRVLQESHRVPAAQVPAERQAEMEHTPGHEAGGAHGGPAGAAGAPGGPAASGGAGATQGHP